MTKKELENKISELEKQIIELKDELEKENSKIPVGEIWKPKTGEKYYYTICDGTTDMTTVHYICDFNTQLMNIGNCYPTEEKAEFEANREKYTRLFRQYVEQHSEPLDWNNYEQFKFCIYYDNENQRILCWESCVFSVLSSIYASSKEVLQDAVDFIGEENVKKYILEVGE